MVEALETMIELDKLDGPMSPDEAVRRRWYAANDARADALFAIGDSHLLSLIKIALKKKRRT